MDSIMLRSTVDFSSWWGISSWLVKQLPNATCLPLWSKNMLQSGSRNSPPCPWQVMSRQSNTPLTAASKLRACLQLSAFSTSNDPRMTLNMSTQHSVSTWLRYMSIQASPMLFGMDLRLASVLNTPATAALTCVEPIWGGDALTLASSMVGEQRVVLTCSSREEVGCSCRMPVSITSASTLGTELGSLRGRARVLQARGIASPSIFLVVGYGSEKSSPAGAALLSTALGMDILQAGSTFWASSCSSISTIYSWERTFMVLCFLGRDNKSELVIMMNSLDSLFGERLRQFYRQALRQHPKRNTLSDKAAKVIEGAEKSLSHSRSNRRIDKELGIGRESSRVNTQGEPPSPTISRTKTHSAISSQRSKLTERLFGCEWVYHSKSPSRVLMFTVLAGIILSRNKGYFKEVEQRINDILGEGKRFSPAVMGQITRSWQRVGMLLSQVGSVRWQKGLRELIDKMPLDFVEMVCEVVLGEYYAQISYKSATVLSREVKVSVNFFTISYNEIEFNEHIGHHSTSIPLGIVHHLSTYAVANNPPKYTEEEVHLRKVRGDFKDDLESLLESFRQNSGRMPFMEGSEPQGHSQQRAKYFIQQRLRELQAQ